MSTTITDVTELQAMENDLAEDYVLGNNIDASATTGWNAGAGFDPVGTSGTPFTGTFDGAGYTISDLFINRPIWEDTGLFGRTSGAEISDVILEDVDITGDYAGALATKTTNTTIIDVTVSGSVTADNDYAGGLIAWSHIGTVITDCDSSCSVTNTGADNYANFTGGLVGCAQGTDMTRCFATGAVTAYGTPYVGGLVGIVDVYSSDPCALIKVFATGDVAAYDDNSHTGGYVGGLIGWLGENGNVGCTITDAYALGDVSVETPANAYTGGLVGHIDDDSDIITNAYSTGDVPDSGTVGGLIGYRRASSTLTACFWDTTTSGTANGVGSGAETGATGKTTAQMHTEATFTDADWDFTTIWNINDALNSGYPYFRWTGIDEGDETRTITLSPVRDSKGRIPKGARARAIRSDTGAVVETETLDSSGQATFTELPNDVNVAFEVNWGGTASADSWVRLDSRVAGISEGGTGSSDVYNARSNLGLGSEDTPQFTAIELGHATDTTIARESASKISIEGTVIVRPANYVVAANDAPTHFKAQADYTCDATDDDVQILAAIDALPATGGKVLLSPGTFNVEASLALDSYQTLQGCGRNTILTTTTANLDIITATGSSGSEKVGITLADFCIDGDAGGATNDEGILWTYVDKSEIRNVWSIDNGNSGIRLSNCDFNKLIGNTTTGNDAFGIYTRDTSIRNIISENIVQGNSGDGIYTIESNDSVISKNIIQGNADVGINITYSDGASVTGNIVQGNEDWGIFVAYCDESMITDNQCQGNGYDGIIVEGSNHCIISDNLLTENSQHATNTYEDIAIDADTNYCNIQGNVCRAGGETNKPQYGINIANANCDGNLVTGNDCYDDGFGTGAFNDSGTSTVVKNDNRGFTVTDDWYSTGSFILDCGDSTEDLSNGALIIYNCGDST